MSADESWKEYRNGNVTVFINTYDGTKIRTTMDDEFSADFPESIDMKITDRCTRGCKMCHEGSSEKGEHADLSAPDRTFLRTLRPYTEIAIGGGAATSHPQLEILLKYLKKKEILANITVHEAELSENLDRIKKWVRGNMIKGIGASLHSEFNQTIYKFASDNRNTVLHVIAGLTPLETINAYGGKRMKLLILGYKNWGRGAEYYSEHKNEIDKEMKMLEKNIDKIFRSFTSVSFDNLALRQLNIKEHVSEDVWNVCYQGSDATHTMYVDMVKKEFAATSTSAERYKIEDTVDGMFAKVKGTMDHLI